MKVELDIVEAEGLLELLQYRVRKRWIHRWLRPNCKKCKNEAITISKFEDALKGVDDHE